MDIERFPLACIRCNGKEFSFPAGRELQPDDTLTCRSCGDQFTVAQARKQAVESGKQFVQDFARNFFKRR